MFGRYPAAAAAAAVLFHEANRALPRRRKFEHLVFDLLGRCDDVVLVQALTVEFGARVLERVVACPLVPGVTELLDHFIGRVPLYVASVTPRDDLIKIISSRGLGGYFTEVFGDPPTTKAEAVAFVLRAVGAMPREVVLVGDTAADLDVARAAGLRFIGRRSPGAPPPGPDSVPDLHGVLALLDDPPSRRGALPYRE